MSSTPYGGALTYSFDPDPEVVKWSMAAAIQTVPSRGGQVSYATTRTIGPLIIAGVLRNRWQLLELSKFVSQHMQEAIEDGKALQFTYPERDINFSIYIMAMDEIGIDMSQAEITPFMLTCTVNQDHTQLTPTDISILGNLPSHIGWLDVASAANIATERFSGGLGGIGVDPVGPTGTSSSPPTSGGPDDTSVLTPTRSPRGAQ
jgi:hypothetical protein